MPKKITCIFTIGGMSPTGLFLYKGMTEKHETVEDVKKIPSIADCYNIIKN